MHPGMGTATALLMQKGGEGWLDQLGVGFAKSGCAIFCTTFAPNPFRTSVFHARGLDHERFGAPRFCRSS